MEWWTLVFFMFLFSAAGALAFTGVTQRAADAFTGLTQDAIQLNLIMLLGSAFSSAALDNVIVIAAAIPVVQSLEKTGIYSFHLWWALLLGGTYGGNITMVGSTANIVALGMLERRTGYYMTLRKWIFIGLIGGLVPMMVAQALLLAQLPLMPR